MPTTEFFGLQMSSSYDGSWLLLQCGYVLIIIFMLILCVDPYFPLAFWHDAPRHQNQSKPLELYGVNTRPYMLAAFVISGMYAGLAGGLMVAMDTLAGAERMFWTASGEVVLMTIFGGAGTLLGPVFGAGLIKYMENIISAFNSGHAA